MRSRFFQFLPLLLLAIFCTAGAKKKPGPSVRFYAEASERDTSTFAVPVMLQYPPRQAWVDKIPVINEHDIAAIYPFPADDGTMGCAFKLDEHGTLMLDTLSVEKRGTSVVAVVNGRQVIDMQIDRRVSDGVITVPHGLSPQDIALLTKKYKVLGQPQKGA